MSTPVFPLDPPGINAAGNSKITFVKALANPKAPTLTEVKGGTELSCAIYSFTPNSDTSTVTRSKYCYKQTVETPGRTKYSIEPIEYDYNPQNLEDPAYAYYQALTPGINGYLIDRRGLDAKSQAWAAGQIVDVYPVTLLDRHRVAISAESEGEKLRTRQGIAVIGEVILDAKIAA